MKMHGAGNDFVVLDALVQSLPDDLSSLAKELCRRPFGIGADQLLVVRRGNLTPFFMEIYNADGSRVEMCGNGVRCFLHYLQLKGHLKNDKVDVETPAGVVCPQIINDHPKASSQQMWIKVDMGEPILEAQKIPFVTQNGICKQALDLDLKSRFPTDPLSVIVTAVSMGNPHAVIFVDDAANYPVLRVGAALEYHEAFPERVNVEFVQVENRCRLLQRTWERGVGETYACGSGACATLVAGVLNDLCDRQAVVVLRGGELDIFWDEVSNHVFQTGPSEIVFEGRMQHAF